jgi:hypothetical protein
MKREDADGDEEQLTGVFSLPVGLRPARTHHAPQRSVIGYGNLPNVVPRLNVLPLTQDFECKTPTKLPRYMHNHHGHSWLRRSINADTRGKLLQ